MSQITPILQAVLEAQTKTPEGGTKGIVDSIKTNIKWKTDENGMPNAQRSKRRHTNTNSFCHSYGYELPNKYDSKTCKWKGEVDTKIKQQSRTKWEFQN